jgi:UDP-N-acetylmuramoylalanine--D-glutamate ligase
MKISNKKIGIWGLGIVGKAAIRYLHRYNTQLEVMDSRTLNKEEAAFLEQHNVHFFHEDTCDKFFERNEYVLVSPGVHHHACCLHQSKIICELDLMNAAYKKPIIAVTGSVGKTTIVHLLSQLLKNSMRIATAGNIGTSMLDLIANQDEHEAALLELSSFQLARCHSCTPELAILTNFYPNHLDWHGTQEAYFDAKLNIIRYQNPNQKALLPLALIEQLIPLYTSDRYWYFVSALPPSVQQQELLNKCAHGFFYLQNNKIIFEQKKQKRDLITIDHLPEITFIENWLFICAAMYLLSKPLNLSLLKKSQYTLPEHRLEKVATINGIDFYNDSKATTPASTLAAVSKIGSRPIILIVGGISKGINRTALIENITHAVKTIVCFGKERDQLETFCQIYNKPCKSFQLLDEAFAYCTQIAIAGDQILFSPAGASFDQFLNYQERGTYFKKLVQQFDKEK